MNWIYDRKPEDIDNKDKSRDVLIGIKTPYGWTYKIDHRIDITYDGGLYAWNNFRDIMYNIPCWCEIEEPNINVSN